MGLATIVCRNEIQKVTERPEQSGYVEFNESQRSKYRGLPITDHQMRSLRPGTFLSMLRRSSAVA